MAIIWGSCGRSSLATSPRWSSQVTGRVGRGDSRVRGLRNKTQDKRRAKRGPSHSSTTFTGGIRVTKVERFTETERVLIDILEQSRKGYGHEVENEGKNARTEPSARLKFGTKLERFLKSTQAREKDSNYSHSLCLECLAERPATSAKHSKQICPIPDKAAARATQNKGDEISSFRRHRNEGLGAGRGAARRAPSTTLLANGKKRMMPMRCHGGRSSDTRARRMRRRKPRLMLPAQLPITGPPPLLLTPAVSRRTHLRKKAENFKTGNVWLCSLLRHGEKAERGVQGDALPVWHEDDYSLEGVDSRTQNKRRCKRKRKTQRKRPNKQRKEQEDDLARTLPNPDVAPADAVDSEGTDESILSTHCRVTSDGLVAVWVQRSSPNRLGACDSVRRSRWMKKCGSRCGRFGSSPDSASRLRQKGLVTKCAQKRQSFIAA
ncbi:hypothetical protein C8R45DRAFT_942772 [Mycena sanguinolenta]|nr:hypothetical protein C8R45DRAFT_942772 [Mycena sanguinolenta]